MRADGIDDVGKPGSWSPPPLGGPHGAGTEDLQVGALAAAALSVLAARRPATAEARFAERVEALCAALIQEDGARAKLLLSQMAARGVTAEEIIDRYAPAAARLLGERWVSDELSFAEVSIGAARLQESVRSVEDEAPRRGVGRIGAIPLGQSVLIVAPDFEQHTLGAFVAAARLRRMGFWSHVSVGLTHGELVDLTATQRFAAVGISASSRRFLDPVRKLVESLRSCADFTGVIGVGGWITRLGAEVTDYTGADIVTSDPGRMAALCAERGRSRSTEADAREAKS